MATHRTASPPNSKAPAQPTTPGMALIDVHTVARMLCCSVSQVWRTTKEPPGFPQPAKTGPMSTRWLESEVQDWIAHVVAQRGNVSAA